MNSLNTATPAFSQLPLSQPMQRAIAAAGYVSPTPIQAGTIEAALAGRDVIGTAQTGTGKTAAFTIPIVERLRGSGGRQTALILSPTRELSEQIRDWTQRLGCGLHSALVVGGVGYGPQEASLRRRPAIIVATPGRLVDLLERGTADLRNVSILVLDEADRMLDMGFKPQLDRILRAVPSAGRQTLLFSATMPAEIGQLARMHLSDPIRVDVGRAATPPRQATQDVYLVEGMRKTPLLLSLAEQSEGTMLVFARTKHRTDRIARSLRTAGHSVQRLHADRSQSQRREALDGFRTGRYRILVATDIAARGIDVADIQRVINYDLPHTVEDYVHRVGRTARAGAIGHASSFASPEERGQLHAIERHIGAPLQRQKHADHVDVAPADPPRPFQPRRQQAFTPRHRPSAPRRRRYQVA